MLCADGQPIAQHGERGAESYDGNGLSRRGRVAAAECVVIGKVDDEAREVRAA